MENSNTTPILGEIILYQPDDSIRLEVMVEDETVWLTQGQMGQLFDKDKRTVSEHIGNIFREGELDIISVVRKFRTTAPDGKSYNTNYYNLDVIISVGYRVKSLRGTAFRRWATQTLKQYILKGYIFNRRIEQVENFSIIAEKRLSETDKKIEFLTQYIESVLSDLNDINEDTRMQLEIICKELAELQTNKIWIDKPQNPMLN